LASDALLATLHPLLENVLQTVDHLEIFCLGAPFSWFEKPRNRMGRDLDCMADVLMGFHRSIFSKPNTEFNSDSIRSQSLYRLTYPGSHGAAHSLKNCLSLSLSNNSLLSL
jgi:hypothetical protein